MKRVEPVPVRVGFGACTWPKAAFYERAAANNGGGIRGRLLVDVALAFDGDNDRERYKAALTSRDPLEVAWRIAWERAHPEWFELLKLPLTEGEVVSA